MLAKSQSGETIPRLSFQMLRTPQLSLQMAKQNLLKMQSTIKRG